MRLSTRLAGAMVLLVLLTVVAVGLLTYVSIEPAILPDELDRVDRDARALSTRLQFTIESASADVLTFRAAPTLDAIVRAELAGGINPTDGRTAAQLLDGYANPVMAKLAANPAYARIRVIGAADGGREILRLERSSASGALERIPDAALRRQSERPYVRDSIDLAEGEVYVGGIDLKQRAGAIEVPNVPVLRVATPIRTPAGKRFGIVIIDMDMRPLFTQIRAAAHGGRRIYVVNREGDYLVHPDQTREFGFEFGKRFRWQDDLPELAAALGASNSGFALVHDAAGERIGAAVSAVQPARGPLVKVIETVPYAELMAPAIAIQQSSLIAAGLAVACAVVLAGLIARTLVRPLSAMTRAVEAFGHDRPIAVPVGAGGEIGVLARAFARMVGEVEEKTAALRKETEDRHRTETELALHTERERLFSAAVEFSDDAIVTKTLAGIITAWNPAAERMFGYTAQEAIGRNIEMVVPENRRPEERDILARIGRGERIQNFETQRIAKNGALVDVSLSISPVKSPSGEIIGASKIARDISERLRTQAALFKEIEERRQIFETSLDLVAVSDRYGKYLRVSPSALDILGYTPEEMIGRNGADFILADDLEGARREMRTARGGHATRAFECRFVHKDGRIVTLAWSGVWSPRVKRHFFIGRDVTEQKFAEEKFRLAVDASPSGIVMIDGDGVIVLVNAETERIFGYARAELIGRPVETLVPARLRAAHAEHIRAFAAKPETRRMGTRRELFGLRKDGGEFPVEIGLNPIRTPRGLLVLGMIVDISESMKAREALLDSERMARGVIDTALDAFVQIDEAGRIVDWNPQAETVFGWARGEAIGQALGDLIVPERDRTSFAHDMAQFMQSGEQAILGKRFELDAQRRDSKALKIELSVTALRQRGRHVFNGFIRDLTEKIAADEQRRQSQKMETVGQLTGGIAHDFNNILTVITGTIEILEDGVANDESLFTIAKMIDEAAARGAELTQRLLAFARRQPLQPRTIDVNALIVDAAKLLRPTLGEHVEIESALEDDAWRAMIDPSQLTTALINLALNARDAMPNGGKLTLETGNVHLDEAYAGLQGDIAPGAYVMIAVSDNGHGIPAEIRDKVFEPFFTTKGTGKGTGLGLSMVYGFVKQSNGHIRIYSEDGHGTTIKLYLPRAAEQADESAVRAEAAIEGGTETIFVVEDDLLVRNYVAAQLASLGYATINAANADEALARIDGGAAFDLLFTDVIMPGSMNGRQLADAAARRRPALRVLFTSGYTEDAMVHHGRLDAGVLLLAKPYRKTDLARMIRIALAAAPHAQAGAEAAPRGAAVGAR
ncbi:MAG TPA: PAS domain S-box protein [Xanthobacteraceae bacterium]|nr:PAS domain S-box protein [Xanthobacteraceae bacterium]